MPGIYFDIFKWIRSHPWRSLALLSLAITYYFCLPDPLFKDPTSTVLTARDGRLLGAQIAADGQWRFPTTSGLPDKFKHCILLYEDEYFYNHPGFNPISMGKAFWSNLKEGSVKRGGSTLTQQTIRLSRKGKKRTYSEKFIELILASRLEFRLNKDDILSVYAANAPFGGNVVGLDAASWRYFNRSPQQLSWAESATLAVLPNAPSLIFPGRNQDQLLRKRNELLKKLHARGHMDDLDLNLALAEALPGKAFRIPQYAPHLMQRLGQTHKGEMIHSTIDADLQTQLSAVISNHYDRLSQNEIHNAALLLIDVETRDVLAYIGNTPTSAEHQNQVDVINKPRSTGSILKPFLYASMLDSGEILPNTLVPDVPSQFGNYSPVNFNKEFDGAVMADRALSRSLNVPAVTLLKKFGLERFRHYLDKLKFENINMPASHYGLSLILGGAEANLWDLCKSYAGMAATLNHFNSESSQYFDREYGEPLLLMADEFEQGDLQFEKTIFDAASIYYTFNSMKNVNRPEEDDHWYFYDSSEQIAWKTGTSFGFRDAWAVGITKKYVVGVWAGNADGEGRPGLVGIEASAPILFDAFKLLPNSNWFDIPYDDMVAVNICKQSGYRSGLDCENSVSQNIPITGLKTEPCPYHKRIHLDNSGSFRVNAECYDKEQMITKSWFVLPPLMEHYYKSKNPFYSPLPKYKGGCEQLVANPMQFIYPKSDNQFFLPKDFEGITNEVILRVAHTDPESTVYWYLDNSFLGQTSKDHEMAILPSVGIHKITVIDSYGNELRRSFEIMR